MSLLHLSSQETERRQCISTIKRWSDPLFSRRAFQSASASASLRASNEGEKDDGDDNDNEEELLLLLLTTMMVSDMCGACIRPALSIGGALHGKGKEKLGVILANSSRSLALVLETGMMAMIVAAQAQSVPTISLISPKAQKRPRQMTRSMQSYQGAIGVSRLILVYIPAHMSLTLLCYYLWPHHI